MKEVKYNTGLMSWRLIKLLSLIILETEQMELIIFVSFILFQGKAFVLNIVHANELEH